MQSLSVVPRNRAIGFSRFAAVAALTVLGGGLALAVDPVYGSAEADAAVASVTALKAWGLPLLFAIGMSFIAFAWLRKVGKPKG